MALTLTANPTVPANDDVVVKVPLFQGDGVTPLDITGYSSVVVTLENPHTKVSTALPGGQVSVSQQQVTNGANPPVTQLTWVVAATFVSTANGGVATCPLGSEGQWEAQINVVSGGGPVTWNKSFTIAFTVARSLS